jgi:UMF1 family MFS transporter
MQEFFYFKILHICYNRLMQSRRNIFLWALYDFANSIITIVFFLYFAQWIVVERGFADIWYNLTFTVSAVLLLLTVPIIGFFVDKFWRRLTGLRMSTGICIMLYLICVGFVVQGNEPLALVFFAAGMYTYLLTFSFYGGYLNDIASPERRGRVSGIGIAANYVGQFVGLVAVLPFSTGMWSIFGISPRAETLLPSIVLYALCSLPMLIWFHEPKREKKVIVVRNELAEWWKTTKRLFVFPGVTLFLLSYFFFNDAILTTANNFPIFLEQVWGVSDIVKTYLLLGILVTSALGGYVAGILADRFGHKKVLMITLIGWVFILPLVGLVTNFTFFAIITTTMGIWFGGNWAVSRSMLAHLAPPQGHNLVFGYFSLAERASSFVGPIVWGLSLAGLAHLGSDKYRYATVIVTVFILIGIFTLMKVKSDREA